jgi:hypothetical protein
MATTNIDAALKSLDEKKVTLPAAVVCDSRLYIRLFGSGERLLAQVQAAHDVLRELPRHAITYTCEHTALDGGCVSRYVFTISTPWYEGAWPVQRSKKPVVVLADNTSAEHNTEARLWIKAIYAIAELRTCGAAAMPAIHM